MQTHRKSFSYLLYYRKNFSQGKLFLKYLNAYLTSTGNSYYHHFISPFFCLYFFNQSCYSPPLNRPIIQSYSYIFLLSAFESTWMLFSSSSESKKLIKHIIRLSTCKQNESPIDLPSSPLTEPKIQM